MTLTPDIVEMLKANMAGEAHDTFRNQREGLANRFAGTSGTRSGAFANALGQASSGLGANIARGNRDIDIAAAQQGPQDIMNAVNLGQNTLQLLSQIPLLRAQLVGGSAPSFLNAGPSPLQTAFSGIGNLAGNVFSAAGSAATGEGVGSGFSKLFG